MTEKTLSPTQTGTALASVFGAVHLLWVVSAATGIGKQLISILESAHFLTSSYTATSFSFGTAVWGLLGAIMVGYILGWLFAWSYNKAGRFTR